MKKEEIQKQIEGKGLDSTFWNVFSVLYLVAGSKEWESALENVPEYVQELVQEHGFEANLDWSRFDSSSFFGLSFDVERMTDEEKRLLYDWYEENYHEYANLLDAIEEAIFKMMIEDEDFAAFCEAIGWKRD